MRQCLVGLLNVTGHLLGYITDRITCTGVKTIRKTSLGKFFAIYELSELVIYITHVRAKKINPSGLILSMAQHLALSSCSQGVHADRVFYQVRWFLLKPNLVMKGVQGEQVLVHISYHTQMWSETDRNGWNSQGGPDREFHS